MAPWCVLVLAIVAACHDPLPRPEIRAPGTPAREGASTRIAVGEAWLAPQNATNLVATWDVRADERYVVLLASLTMAAGVSHRYRVRSGTARGARALSRMDGCSVGAVVAEPAVTAPVPPQLPAVEIGARRSFLLRLGGRTHDVEAEARVVGRHTVVWADVDEDHPAVLDADFVSGFLRDFEDTILPRARSVFGVESDIDGDGRIALVFSPLTGGAAVAFFSSCDLDVSCTESNRGEVLYLTPPNAIRPPYNTPRAIKEILAHELEHLLHHNHKVLATALDRDPDSLYMLEGFGALAQDVTGSQAGNLYVAKAGLEHVDQVSLADILMEGRGYDATRDGPLRGAAYLFTRWLYDRAGGDVALPDGRIEDRGGPSLVRSLIAAPHSVTDALRQRADLERIAIEWYASLALPAGGSSNPCLSFAKPTIDPVTNRQRGADPHARFHGQSMSGASTVALSAADGTLLAGGAEYFAVDAGGDEALAVEVGVDAGADARLVVIRTR